MEDIFLIDEGADQSTNSSSSFRDDDDDVGFPYQDEIFTLDTANAQIILILAAAAVSLLKTVLASGAYSYFHPALSILSFALLFVAFIVFLANDYKEEKELEPDGYYGDNLFLYEFTYMTGCTLAFMNILLTAKTVYIYYRMKDLFPDQTRDETKKTAANKTRCVTLCGSVVPILLPLLSFMKTNWNAADVLPYNFNKRESQLLLTAAYHAVLAIFVTFMATFIERQFNLMKVIAAVSQMLFLVQIGLSFVVMVRLDGRGSGGLTFLSLMTTFQGIEFNTEAARLGEWFALANPPEEDDCEEQPDQDATETTEHNHDHQRDPNFPVESSRGATENDTDTFHETESLTIGTFDGGLSAHGTDCSGPSAPSVGNLSAIPSVQGSDRSSSMVSDEMEEVFDGMDLDVGDLFTMKQ